MKTLCSLLVALTALLGGCAPGPGARVDFDAAALRRVQVAPLVLDGSLANALILGEGRLLTCSHAIPRGRRHFDALLAGRPVAIEVLRSGDDLRTVWPAPWDPAHPPDPTTDWALLRFEPTKEPGPVPAGPDAMSDEPPYIGESVFVVGYLVEENRYVRKFAPALVTQRPKQQYQSLGETLIWLQGPGSKATRPQGANGPHAPEYPGILQRGLSGSPVVRRTPTGDLRVCAMLVGVDYPDAGTGAEVAVAIPIPRSRIGEGPNAGR